MKQSNFILNRKLAWVCFVVAIIVSVFGIGAFKLNSLNQKTQSYYHENIQSDLQLRINAAKAIVQVGEANLPAGDSALKMAQSALQEIETAQGDSALLANADLTSSIGMLYETLRSQIDSEKGSVLQGQWSEFTSRQNIIDNSIAQYNTLKNNYINATQKFPASLLANFVA